MDEAEDQKRGKKDILGRHVFTNQLIGNVKNRNRGKPGKSSRLSHDANLSSAKPRIRAPPLFRDQKSPNHFALGSVTEPVSHKLTVVTQLRVERSNLEIGKTSMGAAPKKRTTSLFPISLSSFFPAEQGTRKREREKKRRKRHANMAEREASLPRPFHSWEQSLYLFYDMAP